MKKHNPTLLLVEDEKNLGKTLQERLGVEGYEIQWAQSAEEAIPYIENQRFDVALLDVGLPGKNGFWLADYIRKQAPEVAIVFLTAYGTPEDRVKGLEFGAYDYIPKPFDLRELIIRLRFVWERAIQIGDVTVDTVQIGTSSVSFRRYEVVDCHQKKHPLTHKECAVLKLLFERKSQVVSREQILNYAWGASEFPSMRTIDNFIVQLRKKIERSPQKPEFLKSVRGVGYILDLGENT